MAIKRTTCYSTRRYLRGLGYNVCLGLPSIWTQK